MAGRAQSVPAAVDSDRQLGLLEEARAATPTSRSGVAASARPAPGSRSGGRDALPRLAVSPDEAAELLGVSRDYFDEHIIHELRVVRRGRRILIALAEIERWLDRNAARITVGRG